MCPDILVNKSNFKVKYPSYSDLDRTKVWTKIQFLTGS